jgi:L-fucose isomerase-like protein
MTIAQAVAGVSGFQANPARINAETGEVLFAHCTVPLDMVSSYAFDTHFESGIGIGIRGRFEVGPVTVFKLSGDLKRCFVAEGMITGNQAEPDLCRTQVLLRLDPADARRFLTDPTGNHHILIPGRHKAILEEILR